MKCLRYSLRLLTLGPEELFFFDSILGVIDLTFPDLDNEPCEGKFSPPYQSRASTTPYNPRTENKVLLESTIIRHTISA